MPSCTLRPLAAALALGLLAAAAPATAADARTCRSADLRYPFQPGGPKHFGVFELQVTGGSCTTARRVARGWQRGFEDDLTAGRVKLRRTVAGFRVTSLPPNEPQTYRLRGRKGSTSVRFDYVVPNG